MSDPAQPDQPPRGLRAATLLIAAHTLCLLLFLAGAAITLWTFARNGQSSFDCGFGGACAHHSYVLGVTLLVVGFVGNVLAIAVGARLAIGFGLGAFELLRRRNAAAARAPSAPAGSIGGVPPEAPRPPAGPSL